MSLLLAMMLQSAVPPARPAAPAVATERPRLSYRFDDESPGRPEPGRPRSPAGIDWQSLDSSLARSARRETRATPATAPRPQLWRGVPVVIVDGRRHGVW